MNKPFQGFKPSMSVERFWRLVDNYNQPIVAGLTDELILAICWEETFFTNKAQVGGSAIGFGQTEPAELNRMNQAGYIKVNMAAMWLEDVAISAVVQMLGYYVKLYPNRRDALKAYAGYNFRKTKEWHDNRNGIMDGWEACETALKAISAGGIPDFKDSGVQDKILQALNLSRGFSPDREIDGTTFRKILFPS
jgi:hypothetical protein